MVRLLPKTFSDGNQFVSCLLKLFDRVWKDFMSEKKKSSYQTTTTKRKQQGFTRWILKKRTFSKETHVEQGKKLNIP